MKNRIAMMYDAWYQPNVNMAEEDWIYCAILAVGSLVSFNVGLLIGSIWAASL